MKRIVSNIPGFVVGVLFTSICIFAVTQVSAVVATRISFAEYNDTIVMFNDVPINLTETPLVSISNEGNERFITNYMPMRAIFEAMDYGVAWEDVTWERNRRVMIYSEQRLIESDEWINFRDLEEFPEGTGYGTLYFDAGRNTVHVLFQTINLFDIPTAVVGDSIFVAREGLNWFLRDRGLPPIPNSAETAILEAREREHRENPTAFVAFDTLQEFIRQQDSSLGIVLNSTNVFDPILRDGLEVIIFSGYEWNPTFTHAKIPALFIGDTPYVRRAELNPYLVELGLTME